jgi:glutamate---cysteine ligase / carboxylate-amine ligase
VTGPAAALPAFSAFGVELEYMIVSGATLDVLPVAGDALKALSGHEDGAPPADVTRGEFGWSNELVCHLLELKNPRPAEEPGQLAGPMLDRVAEMNGLLEDMGARLMPGGMHPWMTPGTDTVLWPHHNAAIYSAYDRIFNCRSHGWANLQSQHLNLPFRDDAEFARLHAAVRLVLPVLPAVAASSPYVEGRAASYLDARLAAYSTHTAAVPSLTGPLVPDTAVSREQYVREVLEPIYRDVAPHDPQRTLQHEWINARGAIPRFDRSALEIRVLDVQECPSADLGIAALAADAVRFLYEERCSPLDMQQAFPTAALRQILLDCARDAERARIADATYLRLMGFPGVECEAGELWSDLAARMEAGRMPLRGSWQGTLCHIMKEGTLARRLLRAAGPAPSRARLFEVYEALCDCLGHGRMFAH